MSVVTNKRDNLDLSSINNEFYNEQKYCDHCQSYVRFLMSVNHSYCIECGGRVRLFSREDKQSFQETVQRHKWQAS